MHRFWVLLSLGLMAGGAAFTLHDMHSRVVLLEQTPRADPAQVARMRSNLDEIQGSVHSALEAIQALRQEGERTQAMRERLAALEHDLQSAARELELQRCELEAWEASQPGEMESLVTTHVDARASSKWPTTRTERSCSRAASGSKSGGAATQ